MIQRLFIGRRSIFAAPVLIALAAVPSVGAADSLGTVRGRRFQCDAAFRCWAGRPMRRRGRSRWREFKFWRAETTRSRQPGAYALQVLSSFGFDRGLYSFSSQASYLAPVMVILRRGAVRRIELDDGQPYPQGLMVIGSMRLLAVKWNEDFIKMRVL